MIKFSILVTIAAICVCTSMAQKGSFVACLQESGLPEDFSKFGSPDSKEVNCFVKCMMTKMGEIDEEGNVLMDKIEENLANIKIPDTAKDNLRKCLSAIDKIGKCEDSKKVTECWTSLFK
uniref:Odorant-binding protein 29 n=1 Tax=Pyrrhalta aenescens TaxID=281545 RepID=A0A1J0KKN5_9CUCU|nr:odorant-binding protein 29 [Pyrrhalta aenescens]